MARRKVWPTASIHPRQCIRIVRCSAIAATLWFLVTTVGHGQVPPRGAAPVRQSRQTKTATARPVANRPQGSVQPKTSGIAAIVNGEKITAKELAQECMRRFGKEVLGSQTNKELIMGECARRGIRVTNDDVHAEVARIAKQFSLPTDRWYALLQDERSITPQQYRRDIVWPTVALRRLANKDLKITPNELQAAFDIEYGPKVQVRLISTKSQAKAQKLHTAARNNPDQFDRLAKDHSEDQNSAAARGLIPPIRRGVGDPNIEKTAFALKTGEISPIVHVAEQYVIMKCEAHIPAASLTPEQRKTISVQLRESLTDRKLRMAGSKLFAELQKTIKIRNVYTDKALRSEMPGVAAIVGNRQITTNQLAAQCMRLHGAEVLQGEINRRLLTQALKRRSVQVTKQDIDTEIRHAAELFGHLDRDGKVDVDSWLAEITKDDKITVDLYVRDAVWPSVALKKLVDSQVSVTKEDLEKGFLANYGPRVEVLAIVLADQRTAQKVFQMVRNDSTDRFFGEVANQYSVEAVSRANYGQVPPIRQHGGQPLLEEEAYKLKPGETSSIVNLGDKFVILRCLGRTKPVVSEIAAVQAELTKDIREKKLRLAMTKEFDRLRESSQIDNFLVKTTQSPRAKSIRRATHTAPTGKTRPPAARRKVLPVAVPPRSPAKQ